jgi:hypothetical protein
MSESARALREANNGGTRVIPGTYLGKVAKATVEGQPLTIVLPNTDLGTGVFNVHDWVAKPDGSNPSPGDECRVEIDETLTLWVAQWRGSGIT